MSNFKNENLEIVLNLGSTNKITWNGISDNRDPFKLLNTYFNDIMKDLSGKELEIDFLNLKYMNSSTVTPIIQLIKDLNNQGISTTVFYDKNSNWQLASFKALETISTTLTHIKIVGK